MRKKTHEQYVAEVAAVNPDIEVIGGYKNSRTAIEHRCKKCGNVWYPIPNNVLSGKGCPECAPSGKNRKTHEQYINEVLSINSDIYVIGHYDGSMMPIDHKCKICGNIWAVRPNCILHGAGCPECAKRKMAYKNTKTHEEYVYDVASVNPNVEVVGCYKTAKKEIMHKCKICENVWYAPPYAILLGRGCPECSEKKRVEKLTKTHDKYVAEVADKNPDVIVIGKYNGALTKIEHKCKKCGIIFPAKPSNILCGNGCPKCNSSKGEKTIAYWLSDMNISYERQKRFSDCKYKYSLPFDFYLPDYNIAIEYNGKQHYEPIDYFGGEEDFEIRIKRDQIKENYCRENNITLITIPYYVDIYEELDKLYELISNKEVAV